MRDPTQRTRLLVDQIQSVELRSRVLELFETKAALFGPATPEVLDRVRFSVVRLAMRGTREFEAAAELYRTDTRDLLVIAEFADQVNAHDEWSRGILGAVDD